MSHNTKIETQFKDLKALAAACKELGFELKIGEQHQAMAWGRAIPKTIAIIATGAAMKKRGAPFAFDIGVTQNDDKSYSLVADMYAGHMEKVFGKGFEKIKQLYAVHQTMILAKKRGYTVTRKQVGDKISIMIGGIR